MSWKKPSWDEEEKRVLGLAWTSDKETEGGHVAGGERSFGRERVGGRRWRSLERASAVAPDDVDRRLLGCVDGVGGGAEVAPPCMFGSCCLYAEEDMSERDMKVKVNYDLQRSYIYI